MRILVVQFRQAEAASFRNFGGPCNGFRILRKKPFHFSSRFQVAIGSACAPETGIVDGATLTDAGNHIVENASFGGVIEHVIGGDCRHSGEMCQLRQGVQALCI